MYYICTWIMDIIYILFKPLRRNSNCSPRGLDSRPVDSPNKVQNALLLQRCLLWRCYFCKQFLGTAVFTFYTGFRTRVTFHLPRVKYSTLYFT